MDDLLAGGVFGGDYFREKAAYFGERWQDIGEINEVSARARKERFSKTLTQRVTK